MKTKVTGQRRGHLIVLHGDGRWRWGESGRFLRIGSGPSDPPCSYCGLSPTAEGLDSCIGHIPSATSAYCGHGVVGGHVKFPGAPRIDFAPIGQPNSVLDSDLVAASVHTPFEGEPRS